MNGEEKNTEATELLKRIKENLESLEKLLDETRYEDMVYRYYHQSFKVFRLQCLTKAIVATLSGLAPHLPMNTWFKEIIREGADREFSLADDANWTAMTRPMVEAFFHAHYFLEMVCKYGKELESPPQIMPSGWASVLYLYNLR